MIPPIGRPLRGTWGRCSPIESASWSAADLVLLDEIAGAIDHPDGFGHIVVDEAQDLSPLQCRVLARRSRHGSLTVLGDLAQGTSAWAASAWEEQMGHLGKPDAPVTALTMGFRVPAVVLGFANQLLPHLDIAVPAATSVRRDGEFHVHHSPEPVAATVSRVQAALSREGSVAVISTSDRLNSLAEALRKAGIEVTDAGSDSPDPRVTMVPAILAKGLEFDHVVVSSPRRSSRPRPVDCTACTSSSLEPSPGWTSCTAHPYPNHSPQAMTPRNASDNYRGQRPPVNAGGLCG